MMAVCTCTTWSRTSAHWRWESVFVPFFKNKLQPCYRQCRYQLRYQLPVLVLTVGTFLCIWVEYTNLLSFKTNTEMVQVSLCIFQVNTALYCFKEYIVLQLWVLIQTVFYFFSSYYSCHALCNVPFFWFVFSLKSNLIRTQVFLSKWCRGWLITIKLVRNLVINQSSEKKKKRWWCHFLLWVM